MYEVWMFSQTANGAKASAVMCSIVETAKANSLTGYNYITYLLEQFSQPEQERDRLMTWNLNLGLTPFTRRLPSDGQITICNMNRVC